MSINVSLSEKYSIKNLIDSRAPTNPFLYDTLISQLLPDPEIPGKLMPSKAVLAPVPDWVYPMIFPVSSISKDSFEAVD